jgi:beta-glucanase (GH16 family)
MRRTIVLLFAAFLLAACVPQTPPQTYAFRDEFNGFSLDHSKWEPNWLAGDSSTVTKPVNGAELACYDPHNATLGNGYLHLRAEHRNCKASNGVTYSYASGLVNTSRSFRFTDGTLEARVFIPSNDTKITNWPAIWTNGQSWPFDGESDVMEGLGGQAAWHYHDGNGAHGASVPGDWSGWHIFAEKVDHGTTTYLYDGHQVGQAPSTGRPHYIVLNLGVGGYGGPIAAPSELLVDWVRVT